MIKQLEVIKSAIPNSNLDKRYIQQDVIFYCQRRYIRPKIGEDLYDELIDQIDDSSLTALNNTLLDDYIKKALAHFVMYESLPYIHTQIGSQGVRQNIDDFSNEATGGDVSQLRKTILQKAEWYLQEMIAYLNHEDQEDSYPLYDGCDTDRPNNPGLIIY